MTRPSALGLYVHIPFCVSACSYCAFSIVVSKDDEIDNYVDALIAEYRIRGSASDAPATIFLGGGTPSAIGATALRRLLTSLPVAGADEVTVELNPESTTRSLVRTLLECGVTRFSLGVQSLDPEVVRQFRRPHSTDQALEALEVLSNAGVPSIAVDLIYGSSVESDASWMATLQGVAAFPVSHVSAYALGVEPRTQLHRATEHHPREEVLADRYLMCEEFLSSRGFEWYEISNWSLPGHRSSHNLNYWLGGSYLGLGCSAHSYDGERRSWNHFSFRRYLDAITGGGSSEEGFEVLDEAQVAFEGIMLPLRTYLGVPSPPPDVLAELDGFLVEHDGRAILTPRGRLMADAVALRLAR